MPAFASSPHRFSPELRLRNRLEFQEVYRKAKRFASRNMVMLACQNQREHARLGVSIAKRQVRKAVARNRLRRLIRETFRLYQHQLKGLDVIVIMYNSAEKLSNAELRQELTKLWEKLSGHWLKA